MVYLVGYKEMGTILRQARELGLNKQIVSFSMFEDPEILRVAGNAANGVYYSFQTYDPTSSNRLIKNFSLIYKKKYDLSPDIFAALGYDAARIIVKAIQDRGINPHDIKQAIYSTKNFEGVSGTTSFNEKGDVAKTMSIKKVESGKFIWIHNNYHPY